MPTSATHAGNGKSNRKHSGAKALKDLAVSTVSAEALIDLIEKLGLKDLLIGRLRDRLENVDIDGLIDDAMDYCRRNPEVVVIALGALTIAAGAIVFLEERRSNDMSYEEMTPVARIASERRATRRAGGSR